MSALPAPSYIVTPMNVARLGAVVGVISLIGYKTLGGKAGAVKAVVGAVIFYFAYSAYFDGMADKPMPKEPGDVMRDSLAMQRNDCGCGGTCNECRAKRQRYNKEHLDVVGEVADRLKGLTGIDIPQGLGLQVGGTQTGQMQKWVASL